MKNIILIGAGGHAYVIIDIIKSMIAKGENINIKGLLDDRKGKKDFMGYPVLDKVENANLYSDDNTEFIVSIGDNNIRKNIVQNLGGVKYFTAIHETSMIGSNVSIGEGSVVMAKAVINANTSIGNHVIINSGSVIEHDNIIKNFVHISPTSTLCGGVIIEDCTFIGANSTVIPYIKIGSNTIIGAGSTVITNIQSGVMAVGSPAKIIKTRL